MKRGLGLAAVVATLLGALAGTAPAAVAEVPAPDCGDGYDFGLTTWEMYGRWLTAGVEVVDCTTGLGAAGQVAIVAAGDGLPTDIDAAPGVTTMVGGLVGAHAELPSFESETAVVVLFRPAGSDQTVAWPTFVTTEAAPVLPVSPTASVAVSRPDGSRYPDGSVQAGARLDIGG